MNVRYNTIAVRKTSAERQVEQFRDIHQHGVSDEENRGVVASKIPVSFLGVELDSKASGIPHSVS